MRPLPCASLCALALSATACLQAQDELQPHRPRSSARVAGRDAEPGSVAPAAGSGGDSQGASGDDSQGASGDDSQGASGDDSQATSGVRELLVRSVINARDLGGTPLAEDRMVRYGELQRGPVLARLTDAGCAELAQLGIRSVLDLREPSERASVPESACVEELATVVHAPLPIPYSLSAIEYLADLNSDASIARAFELLGDPAAYPVYFHCTYGRDRTGVLAALILLALGASPEAVLDEYQLSSATVGATPSSLQAVLSEIKRRGGIEAHLGAIGVSSKQLEVLRARAVVARAAE